MLLFNKKDQLSYEEIEEGTGLIAEYLNPPLAFFVKTKLLEPKDRDSSKLYILNDDFASKKVEIDVRDSVKSRKRKRWENYIER